MFPTSIFEITCKVFFFFFVIYTDRIVEHYLVFRVCFSLLRVTSIYMHHLFSAFAQHTLFVITL